MADTFISACFSFPCSPQEWELLRAAFLLSLDLGGELEPEQPSTDFMTEFPSDGDDRWSGFRALFDDPDFPDFGADLAGGPERQTCRALISGERDFQPLPVARLIQRCCRTILQSTSIPFEWAVTCTRQRVGEFGGGWCVVRADRIEMETTSEGIRRVLADIPGPSGPDYWSEDPAHPISDWQADVLNDSTRLGYWEWLQAR